MKILPGTPFTSDIDIIGCYSNRTGAANSYKTWEVKVSLIDKEGKPHSLKAGKTKDVLKQLHAYRDFGDPSVSLLESYICEDGYFQKNGRLPDENYNSILEKFQLLKAEGFGYQLLPIEISEAKFGGKPIIKGIGLRPISLMKLAKSEVRPCSENFLKLVEKIWGFIMSNQNASMAAVHKQLITYCHSCKSLCMIERKTEPVCPKFGKAILFQ